MAQRTLADGVDVQTEEEKKQEEHQTIPRKTPEKEADSNTLGSESTDGTDSPGAGGGGHPTPEDESGAPTCLEESQESESGHLITCTFSVSLALPLNLPRRSRTSSAHDISRTSSKVREGLIPRMNRFYHIEYFLLPDDIEPRKVDLVLFGPVAKIFLDSESKVVKPWLENDQIWVSWSHSIEINVTNDFLMKLTDHKIKLRLWDNKERMCARAKFCKPKGFGVSQDQLDGDGWVKHMVLFQREHLQRTQPKLSYTKVKTAEVSSVKEKSAVRGTSGLISATSKHQEEENNAVEVPTSAVRVTSSPRASECELFDSLSCISISGSIPSPLQERIAREAKRIKQRYSSAKIAKQLSSVKSDLGKYAEKGFKKDRSHSEKRSRRKSISNALEKRIEHPLKTLPKEAGAQLRKYGIAFIQLDLMPLLSGECCVTSQLEEQSFRISNAYLSFSFEEPLMTQKQKQDLNPLIIKILSAKSLPDTPVSIDELQCWCDPVYCKYKFYNLPTHRTQGRRHGTNVFFRDINVILAGTMVPQELHEYLRGPPLEIEVHDRDKNMETVTKKPSLFGEEPGDRKLTCLNPVTSRCMVPDSLIAKEEIWHPYGVAKISLDELLLGEKHLNIRAPIQCCSVQDKSICTAENFSWKSRAADGSLPSHLPMGHYLDSEAYLKVRVEITIPLSPKDEIVDTGTDYCPYSCIIYVFDYKNRSLLSYLLQEITEINAKAFQLDSYPPHIIQKSFSTLNLTSKLSLEEISQMDIITGFHIMDGSIHLLVVEGLKDKALKKMWNKRIDRIQEAKTGRLEILYNPQVSFHQRLYVNLDAVLLHIHLCKPLSSITKEPLLYIRDRVPRACFQALSRLDYVCRSKRLRDVVHYDLLPSAEMIISLGREFGIPLAEDELLIQQQPEIPEIYKHPTTFQRRQKRRSLLDNYNKLYILKKKEMESHTPQDYIQANIENVNLLSKMIENETPNVIRAFPSDGKSVFNYSTQKLNSAEIAKHLLRQEMAQEPGKRYTYSHKYLSGMFDPVDKDDAQKESTALSKRKWLTPQGFVFPGVKNSYESNMHRHMPDEARLAELREKWEENLLHRNVLKPVLDRDRWPWDRRKADFDLYSKPSSSFVVPDTHFAKHQKDVCCNTALKVHRCSPATELISSGPKASCQLSRHLQGLLKDKPMKLALKSRGTNIQAIPVVGIVDRVESDICRGFTPGSDDAHSLKWSGNAIPCYDREYSTFTTLKGADSRLNCQNRSFNYKGKPPKRWLLKNEAPASGDEKDEGNFGVVVSDILHTTFIRAVICALM